MRRRTLLRAGGAATVAVLAGCTTGTSADEEESAALSNPPWSRENAVYHQSHGTGMKMVGMAQDSGRTVALSYTYIERFWTVTGSQTQRVGYDREYNAIHLMASVWHSETGTLLPVDAGLRVRVKQDGELLSERAMWPMLSQQMGVHFGDNIQFPGHGEYTFVVDIGDSTVRHLGDLRTLPEEGGRISIDFDFNRGIRNQIPVSNVRDSRGDAGALSPMEMEMVPLSIAPARDELPGTVLGAGTSGDTTFLVAASDTADGRYLTVSPRTPYNEYVLPLMTLSGALERDGTTICEGSLSTAIGPDRGYHYGTTLDSIEAGDELTLSVDTPPQVARHAGYETAFLEMPDVRITV